MRLNPANAADALLMSRLKLKNGKTILEDHQQHQQNKSMVTLGIDPEKITRVNLVPRIYELWFDMPTTISKLYGHTKNSRKFLTEDGRKTIAHIQERCEGLVPHTEDVILCYEMYRARKAGDIDGILKVLMDSLQGFAYVNDRQVKGLHGTIIDDADKVGVRVVIAPKTKSYWDLMREYELVL